MSLILETERLLLRPPQAADIGRFVPLLNDFEISRNLSRVPHPYTEDDGCAFVVQAADQRSRGEHFSFSVLRKKDTAYIGMCGVHPARGFEVGYWVAKPFWGQGYATEAARRVVAFAFDLLGAERVAAGWFEDNPASGRVLVKLGFRAAHSEERVSLSRGHAVYCHLMVMERGDFVRQGTQTGGTA
jgi:[ribosomal protein S5]-alanine N-acetyltransferase